MKNRFLIMALLLAASCAAAKHKGEPTEAAYKYMDMENQFTSAVRLLTIARNSGKIDDDAYRFINPVIQEGNITLNAINKSIDEQLRTKQAGEKIVISLDLSTTMINILEKILYLKARYG